MVSEVESESIVSTPGEAQDQLSAVLKRLSGILREENELLESAAEADHTRYIDAKNQALRELMVMQRARQANSVSTETMQNMREVRKLVDRNSQLLKLQVSALNDLTSFLTQSMISEQGDGTYSRDHQ
jgi:hypothetical protein